MLDLRDDTLAHLFTDWFAPIRLRGRTPNTLRLYRTTLANFERFLGRPPLLADLNDLTVGRFLGWTRSRGRSASTANKELANLGAIWRWAARQRRLDGSPVVACWPGLENEPAPRNNPQAWMQGELQTLFRAVRRQTGTIGDVPASGWWYALHCVMWDSGERIGALIDAKWDWLDLDNGWLSVPAEARKGRRMGRLYKLHAATVEALREIGQPGRDRVWPWPYAATYLWRRYDQILQAAGLPHDRKSKFHRLRRSHASFAEAAGLNATELLGHSARRVTVQSYLDERIVERPAASSVLWRPDGKGSPGGKGGDADARKDRRKGAG